NAEGGPNSGITTVLNAGPPGLVVNGFLLPGLETQVLAGTQVHRLRFDNNSILQTNPKYQRLFKKAYPNGVNGLVPNGSSVSREGLGAAKAIAAYERTLLANQAPFQLWLQGNHNALNSSQLEGALLFFGKANCVSCHTGPALSTAPGTPAERMFFNVGFKDLNTKKRNILGTVSEGVSRGRGNFTGNPNDDYKFKTPQLYNLANTKVFGHGGSFKSLKQVLNYKNRGKPQRKGTRNLAEEFQPLNLTTKELKHLHSFLATALLDPNLKRYQPRKLPSGNCFPAADFKSALDLRCW
ncbi:MAG: hypothetical protein KTR32_24330, partial [Granulosicoccus sp.]|nr:hypothetical protein [Granulosicoccus sp.]